MKDIYARDPFDLRANLGLDELEHYQLHIMTGNPKFEGWLVHHVNTEPRGGERFPLLIEARIDNRDELLGVIQVLGDLYGGKRSMGIPPSMTTDKQMQLKELVKKRTPDYQIMAELGIERATLHRTKAAMGLTRPKRKNGGKLRNV